MSLVTDYEALLDELDRERDDPDPERREALLDDMACLWEEMTSAERDKIRRQYDEP